MSGIVDLDDSTIEGVLASADEPVLVDVSAPWCGPCKMMEPGLAQLAREREGKLKVVRIDNDASPSFVARHGVRGLPTFLLFRKGELVARRLGATRSIASWVDSSL